LIALELGRADDAQELADRVVAGRSDAQATCQALEVLGRLARGRDLDEAQARFRRCALLAEAADLRVWRARAMHEDATIDQLRSLDVGALHRARQAAVEAGAPGLVSAVDFHLAAVLGVRFESDLSLRVARGLLADARAQGARRTEAWAWVLIGQAHAVAGHRARAAAAGREATTLAAGDLEIEGVATGTCHALPALLDEDRDTGLAQWRAAVGALRRLPAVVPLPPWYLWPVLATVEDLDGDGGARARAEGADPHLSVLPGVDAVRHLADAVDAGRRGDPDAAAAAALAASLGFARVPAFVGWRHLAHRWVAADAIAAGWGEPAAWMTEAADWFAANGLGASAAACRQLGRRAGAPTRRRGRGRSPVPSSLHRLGVTSREMDVLRLVADGLTNAEIAERLFLSPRTVKGYVEQLLAKTGAANRTQLAGRLAAAPRGSAESG
jgi:DNA-binding CsgD family transcriptional regulator